MSSPKESKRRKVGEDEDVAVQMWEHFRNYLDSLENDPLGDVDELEEMIELSKTRKVSKADDGGEESWTLVTDLLPMLVSVGYYFLAESAIAEYLQPGNNSDDLAGRIQTLLIDGLDYYPRNAATWLMGANFGRMTHRLSLATARHWYERAAEHAFDLRTKALELLMNDTVEDAILKEWIELLVLNHVVGVQFQLDDDAEVNTDQEEIEEEDDEGDAEKDEHDESEGCYSASTVEGTSRLMCSMLGSMEGRHDAVLNHLKHFGFTHRLHPKVWNATISTASSGTPRKPPVMFAPKEGFLPDHIYQSLKTVFAPSAPYWVESNYIGRGYYSYFMEYDKKEEKEPRNLIEDVVVNHLLPRVRQVLDKEEADSICGFEWWTHTRPFQANLGHNLHFDTDESLLRQEKKVTHPILSSVLYLTGGSNKEQDLETSPPGGATIVLDQSPEADRVASRCWKSVPVDNSLLLFPGNLLHGVLPCTGRHSMAAEAADDDVASSKLWKKWCIPASTHIGNRLTFMVGFWTRNVPKTMKKRNLYGPCGPLPPPTMNHSWVQQINKGYEQGKARNDPSKQYKATTPTLTPLALPEVCPAWESIQTTGEGKDEDGEENLVAPPSIDHRFFVKDAPECFYQCLFEEERLPSCE